MALYQHLLFNHGFFSEFIKPFEMKVTRTMFSLGFLFDALQLLLALSSLNLKLVFLLLRHIHYILPAGG